VSNYYGAEWDATWADVFRTLYDIVPPRKRCSPAWRAPFQPIVWANEAELAETPEVEVARDLPFARLRSQLASCAAAVCSNFVDFRAFALAVEYLEHIHWRLAVVVEAAGKPHLALDEATEIIRAVAERDRRVLDALQQEWDQGRFLVLSEVEGADSPAKTGLLEALSIEDQSLLNLQQASSFSASLAVQPERFLALLQRGQDSQTPLHHSNPTGTR
jgi:hypothetical protein